MIALFVCWCVYSNRQDELHTMEYLARPQVGDVYKLIGEDEHVETVYYNMTITAIKNDSISFHVDESYVMSRSDIVIVYDRLKEMKRTKEIKQIVRE